MHDNHTILGCLKLAYNHNTELRVVHSVKTLSSKKSSHKLRISYLFNSYEADNESGFYYAVNRYYNPEFGVFNSVDLLSDHPNQVGMSPYSAMWGNPINYSDPDGLCPECPEDANVGDTYMWGGAEFTYNVDGWSNILTAPTIVGQRTHAKGTGLSVSSNYIKSDYTEPIAQFAAIGIGGALMASAITPVLGASSVDVGAIKTGVFSLFIGSPTERFTAGITDITMQSILMSATGSKYNFASTISAISMPNQYFLSGFLGYGTRLNTNGKGGFETPSFSPKRAVIGGVFGYGIGKAGDLIPKPAIGESGAAMATFGKNLPGLYLRTNREVIAR